MNEMPSSQPHIERQPRIQEIIKGEPEAVFILTGAMKDNAGKNPKEHQFESGSFSDVDQNSGLATGGKDRMLAAVEIQRVFPKITVVPMSRTRSSDLPTYASVMRSEMEKRGVRSDVILEESDSVDTITSFKHAARLIKEHGWKRIVFVSSEWHLPRSRALLEHIENFSDTEDEAELLSDFANQILQRNIHVQFVSSDAVLSAVSGHYRKLFDKVKMDPGIQSRVVLEEKALRQIQSGSYGKYTLSKKFQLEE